jgi:hypothetical protein
MAIDTATTVALMIVGYVGLLWYRRQGRPARPQELAGVDAKLCAIDLERAVPDRAVLERRRAALTLHRTLLAAELR